MELHFGCVHGGMDAMSYIRAPCRTCNVAHCIPTTIDVTKIQFYPYVYIKSKLNNLES